MGRKPKKKEVKETRVIPQNIISRELEFMSKSAGNLYRAVVVMGKRAEQIEVEKRAELVEKLNNFAPTTDNLEEVFENRELAEISIFYEKKPKATAIAIDEFMHNETYFRNPEDIEEE